MNTLEKSVALAKLMDLKVKVFDDSDWKYKRCYVGYSNNTTYPTHYKPYSNCVEGLAQFAAILLAHSGDIVTSLAQDISYHIHTEPTQESILDEILRMNGVME